MFGLNQMQRTNQAKSRESGETLEEKVKEAPLTPEAKNRIKISNIIYDNIHKYMTEIYMAPVNADPNRKIRLDVLSHWKSEPTKFEIQVLFEQPGDKDMYRVAYIEIPVSTNDTQSDLIQYLTTTHDAKSTPPEPLLSALSTIIRYWQPIIQTFISEKNWDNHIETVTLKQSPNELLYTTSIHSTQIFSKPRNVVITSKTRYNDSEKPASTTFTVQTDKDKEKQIFTSNDTEIKRLIKHITDHYKTRWSLSARYNTEYQRITALEKAFIFIQSQQRQQTLTRSTPILPDTPQS